MKKLRILLLLTLSLVCLSAAASAATIPGQQSIASVTDQNGYVAALTDDDPTTAWTQSGYGAPDITLGFYSATVGEIWIRSGYAYTQNWYSHYDRPDTVKVTVYYQANRYTESYDVYRYRLTDAYRPNTQSADWIGGYQRLLLPKQYTGVTRIELTIESVVEGFGRTGATISDLAVAAGSHATATPKARATATPKPYTVYVTPTPGPWTEEDDWSGDNWDAEETDYDDYIDYITPRPTATPYVAVVTTKPTEVPTPTPTPKPIQYPSLGGVTATLTKRMATRSGPSTAFDEPGSFFSAGDEVKVISKTYDEVNRLYWYQVEFQYKNEWYRAYTTDEYVNVNPSLIPDEPALFDPLDSQKILKLTYTNFGPGDSYKTYTYFALYPGANVTIYAIEDGWAQIEYIDYSSAYEPYRRGWVPLDVIYEY